MEVPITMDDLIYQLNQVHAELKEVEAEEGFREIHFQVKKVSPHLLPLVGMVFSPSSGEIIRMKYLTIPPGSPLEGLLMEAFPAITQRPILVSQVSQLLEKCEASLFETIYPDTMMIVFGYNTNRLYPKMFRLRGLVFDNVTGQILSMTYPVPVEYKNLSLLERENLANNPFITKKAYVVQEALDGTLIRLWFHPKLQKWCVSTNGRINAFEAKWGTDHNLSFGDLFEPYRADILSRCVLDTHLVYLFIMCHPLSIVVINHHQPKVYHVATIDLNSLQEISYEITTLTPRGIDTIKYSELNSQLITPTLTDEHLTYDQVLTLAQTFDQETTKPVVSAGFVVTSYPDEHGVIHRIRVENHDYIEARDLRGNYEDSRKTLLDLMLNHSEADLNRFLFYFPMYMQEHVVLQGQLRDLIHQLIQTYSEWICHRGNMHF
jgi:hypothetical protein